MTHHRTLSVSARGERELVMIRDFDASPAQVFEAYTDPALVRRWLVGLDGWTMTTCEIDLRVGGAYRYEWRHTGGDAMAMGGTFRVVERPTRVVFTERFEPAWYEGEAVNTISFEAVGTRTRVTQVTEYTRSEDRDNAMHSGADGVEHGMKRLDQIFAGA